MTTDIQRIKNILRANDMHEEACARRQEVKIRQLSDVLYIQNLPPCDCLLVEENQ